MRFSLITSLLLIVLFSHSSSGQNSVGVISYNKAKVFDGYNLIYPHNHNTAYLINNCGEIVNKWDDDIVYRPNNTCYITPEGNLIKTKKLTNFFEPIWEFNGEAIIECRTWDNELLWSWEYINADGKLHHDIEPTPYGTILCIAWDHYTTTEAISKGRDSSLMTQSAFSPDKIIEYDPELDSIIWEWKAWDHLVQDRDSTKANYGNISAYPGRIDINYENNGGRADWMHVNSIDYNPYLDQILINVPTFNEFWIIDHSTTTEEAASSIGGLANKGGDILYRWGNPAAYKSGSSENQQLFFQHDASWNLDLSDSSNSGDFEITIFNNKVNENYSSIHSITPLSEGTYNYQSNNNLYLPQSFDFNWTHPIMSSIYSYGLSSVQRLPNNNLLVCAGQKGYSLEIDAISNDIVWEYITPIRNGFRLTQGDIPEFLDNPTFRIRRYPPDYVGFADKELSPYDYIELEPDTTYCDRLVPSIDLTIDEKTSIYPNPTADLLTIETTSDLPVTATFTTVYGDFVMTHFLTSNTEELSLESLESGVYLLVIGNVVSLVTKQ